MPRIRADTVAEHRTLMQTRLLDAFGELMAEDGYAAVTLAGVAERAGMARNTIYNYVAGKEALLMAYVDRSVADFAADLRAELAAEPDAAHRLALLVRRQMHQFLHEPGAGSESGMLDGATLPPASHEALMARFRPLHGLLAEVIVDGMAAGELRAVDPDEVVPMAFAVMGSERLPIGRGHHDPDDAARRVTDFLLHALGAA
ncbi:TetR/AcrR family transcriptional regulator [Iamia sp. SCSIO 61187]|uniref:TetR/AcrR family transcriptional regulator n=1 Tax=Iamia sp. SCSIO 61187 TaxID=2722752 RepID=UPI001C63345F|nr:TetR/AcrR family transcriptional regulator [Iamia sp. SCSIO 61187]